MKKIFFCYAVGTLSFLLLVFSPVVFDSHQLRYDDPQVVAPMEQVHSLRDYLSLKEKNEIYDVQPVRDFSYFLNSHHSGNLVIWFSVALLFFASLIILQIPIVWSVLLGLVFTFNPLFVSSIAWLTARKHLLSFSFTLGLTLVLLMEIRKGNELKIKFGIAVAIVSLYLLALFSHPINIMWPLFALILIYTNGVKIKIRHIPNLIAIVGLGLSGLFAAYCNNAYYSGQYLQTASTARYVSDQFNTVFWKIWIIGRMIFQILCPIQTGAGDHYPYSYYSVFGLVFLVIGIASLWLFKIPQRWTWIAGAFLAVFPVSYRLTNGFLFDNYLLFSSFCIFILIALALKKYDLRLSSKGRTIGVSFGIFLAGLFATRSYFLAKAWNNDFALWEMAFEVEPSAKTAIEYAGMLLEQNRPLSAFEVAKTADKFVKGSYRNSNSVLSKVIYLNPSFNNIQKLEMLSKSPNEWSLYYEAAVLASEGKNDEACERMSRAKEYRQNLETFDDAIELMAAESLYFCQKSPAVGADILRDFKDVRGNGKWNEALFQKRAKELGVLNN
ncbi:hypothetical protein ACLSU7_17920 [Bdellovibrio sp. HCB185ZH]|uniref:hypothetical protein n=1 Tax=Bdellovibrio sp. HCB185ZH TaxID=3394235 RepID=UPI0039A68C5F